MLQTIAPLKWTFVVVSLSLAAGACVTKGGSRHQAGGTQPHHDQPSDEVADKDKEPTDDSSGRLVVTDFDGAKTPPSPGLVDNGIVDANQCTPELTDQVLRAHAVNLDAARVLWVFAGAPAEKSAAISTCVDGQFKLTYVKSPGIIGEPPFQPWGADGKIYIPYQSTDGTRIVAIDNPAADPSHWKTTTTVVKTAVVGTVRLDDFVYLFAETSPQKVELARLKADASGSIEWMAADLGLEPLTGMSIRFVHATSKWLALFSLGDRTVVATADNLAGPWSTPRQVHKDDQGLACNGATELPMFTQDLSSELVISYSCADGKRPVVVRVPLPKD